MLSLRPRALAFLLLNGLLLANAIPVTVNRRQVGPTTLMTQSTTDTAAGPMTQTCVVTLTPITDNNGQPAVQEVTQCTLTMNANGTNNSSSSNSTTTTTSTSSGSSNDGSGSSSSDTSSSTDSGSSSTDSAGASSTDSSGSSATNSANSVSASGSATGTDSAGAAATTTGNSGNAAVSANSISMVPVSDVNTSAGSGATVNAASPATATAAEQQAASPSTSATFKVPGQSIQVLPIGLGVFAGISVIALIVVGLVTYERTKYRKAFRARKLAESGAGMGYGGMAQR